MQQRETSRSYRPSYLLLVCLAVGLAISAILTWPRLVGAPEASTPTAKAIEPDPLSAATSSAATSSTATSSTATSKIQPRLPIKRVAVAMPTATAPPLVFVECVAKLCDMSLRTAELAQVDEIDAAKQTDEKTRILLDRLLQQFPDAGERSLSILVEIAGNSIDEQAEPYKNTKLGVLQVILEKDLSRRNELGDQVKNRTRIDALVQALLDSMPIGPLAAKMGDRCLNDRPFLRIAHEPTVRNLLRLASSNEFPRNIATNMLMTLLDNAKTAGERTAAESMQLALLRLDSSDPSQIVAACRQLLRDEKYRTVVLSWLRNRQDMKLASEIAELVASQLPVRDALEVLRELSPLLQRTRGAYMGLGARAPEVLAEAYNQHLAANNHPIIRRELIMGVGMIPNPAGLKLAELALANDPSPEVRIQAMYVFTVHAAPEAAEQAINQLLDDPAIANNQQHLGAIVLALTNLEHADPNIIARLATRLQSMPLAEYSRVSLAEILGRVLPGGSLRRTQGG